jgi:hypothetical protein
MQKTLKYKGYTITIAPTTIEDWKGIKGYQVTAFKPGFRPVVSAQNFPNATIAAIAVKNAIDDGKIPQQRVGLMTAIKSIFA